MSSIIHSPLGKKMTYTSQYQRELLFPIPREVQRAEIGISNQLPFKGFDIWNAYELSWLNEKGKPIVALGEFRFPCESPNLIESKSFKLYLNSFNNTRFASTAAVGAILQCDLSEASGDDVDVDLIMVHDNHSIIPSFSGICLDQQDIECDTYLVDPSFLKTESDVTTETVYSDLLKSNCLVTGQPDWGSVLIDYTGPKINHEGLLQYIVSFRDHHEFHEQCVERIFMDILRECRPEKLTVIARYTRRGGLDINPFRSTESNTLKQNTRLSRQ